MTSRKSPAPPQHRAPRTTTNAAHSTLYRPEDGYAAPDADERREAELLAELKALGYRVSVPCLVCGHPLTTDLSTSLHVGPKCRAKAAADV